MRYPLALLVCASVLLASGLALLPENHRPSHRPPRIRHIPSRTPVRSTTTTTTTTEEPVVVVSTTATPSTVITPTELTSSTSTTDPEKGTFDSLPVDAAQLSTQILAQQHQQQLALEAMKVAVQTIQTTVAPYVNTQPTQFPAASTIDIQQLIQMMQKGQFGNNGQFSFAGPPSYNPAHSYNSLQYQQPDAVQNFVPDGAYQAQHSYHQHFQPHSPLQQFMQQHPILPYGAPLPYNPPDTPTYVFRDGKYHVQAPGIDGHRGGRTPLAINDTPLTVESSLDMPSHAVPYLQPGQTIPSPMQAQQAFAKLAQEQVQQAITFAQAQNGPPLPYIQPAQPTQQQTSGFDTAKVEPTPTQPSQETDTQQLNSNQDSLPKQSHSQASESQQVFSQPAEQQIEQQPVKQLQTFTESTHQQSPPQLSYAKQPQQQIPYSQPPPQHQVYIQPSQQTQQQLYSQQQIYSQVPNVPQQQIIHGHPHQQGIIYSQQPQVPQQQIPHQQPYEQTRAQTRIVVPEPSATLKAPAPAPFTPSRLISYQSHVAHPTSQTEHNQQQLPHSEQETYQVVNKPEDESQQTIKSPFRTAPQYSEEVAQQEIETKKVTTNKGRGTRPSFLSQLFRGRS